MYIHFRCQKVASEKLLVRRTIKSPNLHKIRQHKYLPKKFSILNCGKAFQNLMAYCCGVAINNVANTFLPI